MAFYLPIRDMTGTAVTMSAATMADSEGSGPSATGYGLHTYSQSPGTTQAPLVTLGMHLTTPVWHLHYTRITSKPWSFFTVKQFKFPLIYFLSIHWAMVLQKHCEVTDIRIVSLLPLWNTTLMLKSHVGMTRIFFFLSLSFVYSRVEYFSLSLLCSWLVKSSACASWQGIMTRLMGRLLMKVPAKSIRQICLLLLFGAQQLQPMTTAEENSNKHQDGQSGLVGKLTCKSTQNNVLQRVCRSSLPGLC